uniref:Mechanosensitive ion channel MscS domain-containing protein n=1 Tax=Cannabis sativa TaxID=3483 RepID=A0A803NLD2_CANSA
MFSVSHHNDLLNLFPHSSTTQTQEAMEFGDLEMVPDDHGRLLRPPTLGLGRRFLRLPNREEFHAQRESSLFRSRSPEKLPELRVVSTRPNCVDDHVPGRSQTPQIPQKDLPIPNRNLSRRNDLATEDRESVFHHYILDALSGPPADEEEDQIEETRLRRLKASKSMPARLMRQQDGSGRRRIDMDMLRKLSRQRRATAWSVRRLVTHVMSSGLSTISTMVDDFGTTESEITSEWEARNSAKRIFKHVAKTGAKYIEEGDLLRFLKYEEVYTIFPLFEGSEGGKISKSSFRNWVVQAYVERKALAHSLNDTKTAVHQLHKLASAVVMVVITVVSLLVMGLATTKVVFVVTSQLLLVGFMFQNTCKTMFESIIFVFVMHPFDVGDRCVVDGIQMIVEEMNILTTVFLRYDNEKIYYPNSVLLTKPISNFRRSPDMADAVEFTIDFSTPLDDIVQLKKAIQIVFNQRLLWFIDVYHLVQAILIQIVDVV